MMRRRLTCLHLTSTRGRFMHVYTDKRIYGVRPTIVHPEACIYVPPPPSSSATLAFPQGISTHSTHYLGHPSHMGSKLKPPVPAPAGPSPLPLVTPQCQESHPSDPTQSSFTNQMRQSHSQRPTANIQQPSGHNQPSAAFPLQPKVTKVPFHGTSHQRTSCKIKSALGSILPQRAAACRSNIATSAPPVESLLWTLRPGGTAERLGIGGEPGT